MTSVARSSGFRRLVVSKRLISQGRGAEDATELPIVLHGRADAAAKRRGTKDATESLNVVIKYSRNDRCFLIV